MHSCRKDDHGNRRPAAKVADEIDAVAVGQSQVENDDVRLARCGVDQTLLHRVRLEDIPTFRFERGADESPDLALVFDQNRDRRRAAHGRSFTRRQ